ncbi:flagellar protein FlaG [Modicisalibacter muralis]|uniref:Flagellar protein FlaG n=1 Tax=Modicisalibacter muralis TaxID=119000 RepID=A0A1G9FW14_9GAMM|nr:flagellar protein FlaG [Halomonas muralis]SDK92542.1 flagellar protein FlaG [Halomonas muralis]
MNSPINDATSASSSTSPATNMTPRQRLENALAHLPAPPGSAASQAQSNTQAAETSPGELVEPVQRINEAMRHYGVEFHLQEFGSRVVTRIVDRESGEVIRQIPSEEVLRIAESLERLQGRLIQHQV